MKVILNLCVLVVLAIRHASSILHNKTISNSRDARTDKECGFKNGLIYESHLNVSIPKTSILRRYFSEHNEKIPESVRNEKCVESEEFTWTEYYQINSIYAFLQKTSKNNEQVEIIKGGRTYEGRDILGVRINTPSKNRGRKPAVFIESGIHADEWITSATITYFINQLLTNKDANITALRDSFDWHIIPVANPDGYQYSCTVDRFWRQTRSKLPNGCIGVDPNRNWDHHWNLCGGSDDPCNNYSYVGPAPFSEIETRTLSEYIAAVPNLLGYLSFHSDAKLLLVPYSDTDDRSLIDNYDDLVKIGKVSLEYGQRVNGAVYDGPDSASVLLYRVSGDSIDWVRAKLNTRLVYTYELRGDINFSWPKERIPELGDEVTQMLLGFAHEAKRLKYY